MKYAAIILNVLGILILGFAISMLTRPGVLRPVRTLSLEAPALKNDDAKQLSSTRQSLASLEQLKSVLTGSTADSNQPLIAQISTRSENNNASALASSNSQGNGTSALPEQRRLTLLLESSEGRRAVIDGRLVGAGDHLPDGSKVLGLQDDRVILLEKKKQQTLTLPLSQLRVGTLSRSGGVQSLKKDGMDDTRSLASEKTETSDTTPSPAIAPVVPPESLQKMADIANMMRNAANAGTNSNTNNSININTSFSTGAQP